MISVWRVIKHREALPGLSCRIAAIGSLAPGLRTQALVKRRWVIVGQDADEQVVGRRPFAAEVAQGAAGEFVAPDVRV